MTQEQAAAAIGGCPLPTYRDWEQGRREPPAWIRRIALAKLAAAAGTKVLETQDGCETPEEVAEYVANEIAVARSWKPAPAPASPSDG